MDDKLGQVILRLLEQTKAGRVEWEDASSAYEGDVFRVNFGDAVVEVKGEEVSQRDQDGDDFTVTVYPFRVLNGKGLVVAEKRYYVGNAGYKQAEELFLSARARARKQDAVLDNILTRLS